jgi:soluble lytic murein transglycosylase
MTNLKRYTKTVLGAGTLTLLILKGAHVKMADSQETALQLPAIEIKGQLRHAKELLSRGKRAKAVAVDSHTDLRQTIFNIVKESLPQEYASHAYDISKAVIVEANHHKMDPFFLLAVIKTESKFNVKAHGTHGEIGLMQILPKTARWMAAQAGLSSRHINLEDPIVNIRIGATYFAHLRHKFEGKGAHYVAAYNMGSKNVRRLLAKNIEPHIYSGRVLGNYAKFYESLPVHAKRIAKPVVRNIAAN